MKWFIGIFRQQADSAVWDSTGTRLLVMASGVLAVVDSQTGEVLARNADFAHAQRMALNDGGTRLALADGEGRVAVSTTTEEPTLNQQPFLGYTHNLHWQPGGDSLLVIDSVNEHYPQALHLFDTNATEPAETLLRDSPALPPPWSSIENPWIYAAWKPDGSQLAVADRERVYLAQPGGLEEIYEATPPTLYTSEPGSIVGLFWDERDELPTAELFWCCSSVHYSVYTGADLSLMPTPYPTHDPEVDPPLPFWWNMSVYTGTYPSSISPEGGYAIFLDDYENGMVWRADGTPLQFLNDVKHVVWTEDDSRLAIVRLDGSLWVLSLADNQLSHVWTPSLSEQRVNNVYEDRPKRLTDETTALVWSVDGTTLAYNYGGVVRVWRLGE
jgi:hypothetical protein